MKRAAAGACGACGAQVWRDKPDGWPVLIDRTPLCPEAVVPALRSAVALYRAAGGPVGASRPLFHAEGRLRLAHALAGGLAPPDDIHIEHRHRGARFIPDPAEAPEALPIKPPF